LLEVEHGGGLPNTRRPCIFHTHIHALPGCSRFRFAFDRELPRLEMISPDSRTPYISVSDGLSQSLYDAHRAIGQETRRVIGRELEVEDWDWATNPNWRNVALTIEYWKGV
jgi:hypothetical protein